MQVGIIGTPGRISGLAKKNFLTAFSEAGGNSGNLLFQYAATSLVKGNKEYFTWESDPHQINRRSNVLILPLANQLGTHTDYAKRAEFINKIDIPIIALGLGAQSHIMTDESAFNLSKKITSGTRHWVEEISAKSEKILVRGNYTQKVCEYMGIPNAESFGCPSNLISSNIDLGTTIRRKLNNLADSRSFILNGGFYNQGKNNYEDIVKLESTILRSQKEDNISIVVQAPKDIMECSYKGKIDNSRVFDVFNSVERSYRLDSFYDINSWVHHTRNFDFSIGTRVHGSILSLQFEQPSLLITHDSRTDELANTMALPHLRLNEALNLNGTDEMLNALYFDGDKFNETRAQMARQVQNIIESLNLISSTNIDLLSKS